VDAGPKLRVRAPGSPKCAQKPELHSEARSAPRNSTRTQKPAPPSGIGVIAPENRTGWALYCGMTSTNPDVAGARVEGARPTLAELMRAARVVDLTLTLSEDLPCAWPGATPYRHVIDNWFETTTGANGPRLRSRTGVAYHTCSVGMDEHTGTHFDAPAHFVPAPGSGLPNAGPAGSLTADRVPLDQFFGSAVVVDVRALRGAAGSGRSPRIEPGVIADWESANGPIVPGDIVLFRGDWDEHYVAGPAGKTYVLDPLVFSSVTAWPAPSPATMELLRDRGVRCVGTDAVSMGPADDAAPVHIVGLSAGMIFIEALSHLGELPTRGATFLFLPVKIAEGSGGPGRALAFIE
jgi:isatin hydrolase